MDSSRQSKPVTKAIVAAAGFGTRFLPQTKSIPKEMLPVVDKPIIQYVVEELVDAGIKDIIMVTGSNKRALEDHFDNPGQDLIENLKLGGAKKAHLIDQLDEIARLANFIYIRQKGPYGNATPLLNAAHLVNDDEPFIYVYADEFFTASPSRFNQMIARYEELGGPILSCLEVHKDDDFDKYGIVAGTEVQPGVIKMSHIVEKPGKANTPSNLASVASYLLDSGIFKYIEHQLETLEEGKEIYLQPAIQEMINDGVNHYGCLIENSKYHNTGDKLDYLKTVFEFALKREDLGPELKAFLKTQLDGDQ